MVTVCDVTHCGVVSFSFFQRHRVKITWHKRSLVYPAFLKTHKHAHAHTDTRAHLRMGLYRVTDRAQCQVINTLGEAGGRREVLRYCLDSPAHASTDGNTSQVRVALPVMASLSILCRDSCDLEQKRTMSGATLASVVTV